MTTLATYVVEVDWNNDGDFSDSNENVTGDAIRIRQMSLGRSFASPLTGTSIAGKLVVDLRNDDNKYSPTNGSSALTGLIKPGRKVQVRTTAPSSATLWVGFLDDIKPKIKSDRSKIATLTATGPLGYINEKRIRVDMETNITTGAAAALILTDAGWPGGDRDLDTGQTTMARWWVEETRALAALRELEASEGGFLREKPDGDIAFEDRHHRFKSPATVSQATYTDNNPAAGGEILYSAPINQDDPNKLIFNEFRSPIRIFAVGSLAVLWTHPETGASSPLIPAASSLTFWAGYPNPQSGNNSVAVDAWTTPASTTDFTGNAAADGSGTNMTSNLSVSVTKYARAMQITVANDSTSSGAYLTKLQARGTPVTEADPGLVSAEDATSQTAHGKRTFPRTRSATWVSDSGEALDWCNFHIGIYKDPTVLLELAFNANRDSDHMAEALARQVSDRVTVEANNTSGFGINDAFFVEKINHRVDPGRLHTVSLWLSPASAWSGFWVLNTSKLDTETRIAY